MTSKKILGAIIAAAAVGVIAGLLLAPDKGSATRNKIKEAGKNVKDTLKEKMNECVDNMKKEYKSATNNKTSV